MAGPTIKFNSWAIAVAKFFDWLKGERDPEEMRKRKRMELKMEYHSLDEKRRTWEAEAQNEKDPVRKKVVCDRIADALLRLRRMRDEIAALSSN
jgi:hypothetical protein